MRARAAPWQLNRGAIKMKRNMRYWARRKERDDAIAAVARGEAPVVLTPEEIMARYVDRVHPPLQ